MGQLAMADSPRSCRMGVCYWIVFVFLIRTSLEESFSSVDKLEALIREERKLLPQLRAFIENIEFVQTKITDYLNEASSLMDADPAEAAKDPLVGFQILRRFGQDLPTIQDFLSFKFSNESESLLPKSEEVYSAAKAIINISTLCKLNATELANGKLGNRTSYTKLTANDCLLITKQINESFYGGDVLVWLKATLDRWRQEQMNIQDPFVQQKAAKTFELLQTADEQTLSNKTDSNSDFDNMTIWNSQLLHNKDDLRNFGALCTGIKLLPPKYEIELKCTLSTRGQAYFILMPIKMEVVSNKPPIFVFYDVVTDKEMEEMKNLSRPRLKRSQVEDYYVKKSFVFEGRVSQSAHIYINQSLMEKISLRVSHLTGLHCKKENIDCEALQVVNYGIGGEFHYHTDIGQVNVNRDEILTNTSHIGRRIATVLFYLSDVELGGYTAFPRAGVFIQPKKGSAVFWYNLLPDGSDDYLTLHGACPIIYGSKWVATKWITEKPQMFVHPCQLYPDKKSNETTVRISL